MADDFSPMNPFNHPPTVYVTEYAQDPSTPGATPIAQQVLGVGTSAAVSAPFNSATNFITMNPQYMAAPDGTVTTWYALGLPPFPNASITIPLSVITTVPVGTGQSLALIASGAPLT